MARKIYIQCISLTEKMFTNQISLTERRGGEIFEHCLGTRMGHQAGYERLDPITTTPAHLAPWRREKTARVGREGRLLGL